MSLPKFLPDDPVFFRWVRAIEDALRPALVVERRYDGDIASMDIVTMAKEQPTSVLCTAATKYTRPTETESGARVTWQWVGGSNGVVRVTAIDLTSATDEYVVTLEVR